jgi:hypothetical protein
MEASTVALSILCASASESIENPHALFNVDNPIIHQLTRRSSRLIALQPNPRLHNELKETQMKIKSRAYLRVE